MEREGERERDGESNHDRCTLPVEKYKVRNPALVPLFVLTAKQKLKWSHLIHSEKWYRLYGQAPYAPAYQTSHPFFCFASHNQKRLKQAEVMENRERTKQHHNFVTLPVYFQLHDKCLFGAPFTFSFVTNTYLGLSPLLQTRPEQIVFTQSLRYSQDLTCPYMLNLHFVSFSDWTFDPGVHSQHIS